MKIIASILFLICFSFSFWFYADRNDPGMTALVGMIAFGIVAIGATVEESGRK